MALVLSADVLLCDRFRFDRHLGRLCERSGGASVPIGSRALAVLGVLVDQPGDLVSKDAIMNAVWSGIAVEESNLTVQISALRRILDAGEPGGSCIQTVPGRGYRFVSSVTSAERLPGPAVPDFPAPDLAFRDGADAGSWPEAIVPPAPSCPTTLSFGPASRWPQAWGRLAIILAVAGIAVLLVAAGGVWWQWPLSQAPPTMTAPASAPAIPTTAPRLSIVVLPFNNLSNDPEQQFFADGVTEDLTTDLSRIAGSFVISRNTAFTYKGKPINAKQIGHELGVRYVLEGSVQRWPRQVRVNAQLIDAETGAHLWAERFERDTGDLFALQNEITGRIAVALNFALAGAEAARPTVNPDSLDYIFRGRAVLSKPPTRDSRTEAIGLFERASALDPGSAPAKMYLVNALTGLVLDGMSNTPAADIARAEALVAQALAVEPNSLLAHRAKAQVLRAQRRCADAIPEYETIIALDRNLPNAYANLGQCKLFTGSIDEVIPLVEQAVRLSPRDPALGYWWGMVAYVHLLQSRTDEAIVWAEKARSANPAHQYPHRVLAAAYGLKGESERAAAELAEARRLRGNPDRLSSITRMRADSNFLPPNIRALLETTYFAGLRAAGMPEE